jgi:molybdopterin-guanine dinucleotide biosynthesis protein MobB
VKQLKHRSYLVCVTGLKNSGKTTVCTGIIADLTARGYRVGALKSSHVTRLALDHRAGDSYALAESGAHFVLVQGPEQSLILEREGRSFRQMLKRVPKTVEYIVSEGGEAEEADSVILCLADPADWEEALRVRRIPRERILALSGPFVRAGGVKTFQGIAAYDAARPRDRRVLVERILQAAAQRHG